MVNRIEPMMTEITIANKCLATNGYGETHNLRFLCSLIFEHHLFHFRIMTINIIPEI